MCQRLPRKQRPATKRSSSDIERDHEHDRYRNHRHCRQRSFHFFVSSQPFAPVTNAPITLPLYQKETTNLAKRTAQPPMTKHRIPSGCEDACSRGHRPRCSGSWSPPARARTPLFSSSWAARLRPRTDSAGRTSQLRRERASPNFVQQASSRRRCTRDFSGSVVRQDLWLDCSVFLFASSPISLRPMGKRWNRGA